MKLTQINAEQWKQVKEIYMEAFPKAERKPFFVLRHSVKSKKAQILTATEDGTLMGFVMVIPYGGMTIWRCPPKSAAVAPAAKSCSRCASILQISELFF